MTISDIASAWHYNSNISDERQAALAEPVSFEELVEMAKAEICNIRLRVQPGRDTGLTDCLQPVFSFELPGVGDRFFNGIAGYRAQYWLDPSNGLSANALLLAELTPKLLANIAGADELNAEKINVCTSLRATSAKFWIQEIPSLLVDPSNDLNVQRWQAEAKRGVQLARWGISAPEVTKFDVKGALLDPYGNEVVPSRKITRHLDIHHYGFS